MKATRFAPLVRRQITRQKTRSALTVAGVAVAVFLFTSVLSIQHGVETATEVAANDTTLVVYRENRYCPFTSRLPQYYGTRITAIPGVRSVVPMRVVVTNCRASLDIVTFRGIATEAVEGDVRDRWEIVNGSFDEWLRRGDGALVGESLATRRGIAV